MKNIPFIWAFFWCSYTSLSSSWDDAVSTFSRSLPFPSVPAASVNSPSLFREDVDGGPCYNAHTHRGRSGPPLHAKLSSPSPFGRRRRTFTPYRVGLMAAYEGRERENAKMGQQPNRSRERGGNSKFISRAFLCCLVCLLQRPPGLRASARPWTESFFQGLEGFFRRPLRSGLSADEGTI